VSDFSDVDRGAQPGNLVAYLQMAEQGLAAAKSYQAAAAARAVPAGGRVLDLGCGVGHDLARLEASGLTAVGVDTSEVMLREARQRAPRLARADGAALPFAPASFDGVRIERVLQHVHDPATVVGEVRRILRDPGGFVTVFEPDYTGTFRVESEVDPAGDLLARHLLPRHPGIGGQVAELLRDHGFRIDDIVAERSFGYSLRDISVDVGRVLGRVEDRTLAEAWLEEQRTREAAGTLRTEMTKVLVVAHLP
jgi:SAM-dependent methyltransferase